MGMSSYAYGYLAEDEKWNKMKKVYISCKEAGVDLPKEVDKYFEYGEINPLHCSGARVRIDKAVTEYNEPDRCAEGLEVDLTKIPEDVKVIRFINSW